MKVRIDYVKDIIEAVNPITGKIETAEKVKNLTEQEPIETINASELAVANESIAKLQTKVTFLEGKLTTLSISDWNEYNNL